ncbi:uncharacterized protein LOC125225750 [Leguminivora glycinivorella]|uniref:uncharacterized protein LOC125225750 n=1 Tax=Leguminivora glycinivorella TaxID=1035111 RepID=UPI002010837A|nr:uncharacterized protein LOC125225750 [Leguminivora glycinivorella]
MHLLSTIINYVNLHETDENKKACKRDFFTSQTLKAFLTGLKDPLGVTIRTMRPSDMPTALQFIKEEQNIHYLQKRQAPQTNFQKPLDLNKFAPHNLPPRPVPFANLNKPSFSQRQNVSSHQNNYRPFYPNPYKNNPWNRPQYPYNPSRQFSGQQTNKNVEQPKPMSGISYRSAQVPLRPYMPAINNPLNNHTCQTMYQQQCPAPEMLIADPREYAAITGGHSSENAQCDNVCTDYLDYQQYHDNYELNFNEQEINQDFPQDSDTTKDP